jgi:hypothetical protein
LTTENQGTFLIFSWDKKRKEKNHKKGKGMERDLIKKFIELLLKTKFSSPFPIFLVSHLLMHDQKLFFDERGTKINHNYGCLLLQCLLLLK